MYLEKYSQIVALVAGCEFFTEKVSTSLLGSGQEHNLGPLHPVRVQTLTTRLAESDVRYQRVVLF